MTEKKIEIAEEAVELTETDLHEAAGGAGYLKLGDIKGEIVGIKAPTVGKDALAFTKAETTLAYPKIETPLAKSKGR